MKYCLLYKHTVNIVISATMLPICLLVCSLSVTWIVSWLSYLCECNDIHWKQTRQRCFAVSSRYMWFKRCTECPKGLLQGTGFLAVEWGFRWNLTIAIYCYSVQARSSFLSCSHVLIALLAVEVMLVLYVCMCVCLLVHSAAYCCHLLLLHAACRLDMHNIISRFFCAFTFTFWLKWFRCEKRTLTTNHCHLLKVFSISSAYISMGEWLGMYMMWKGCIL